MLDRFELSSRKSRSRKKNRRLRSRRSFSQGNRRLFLETLEDRRMLATFIVNSTTDGVDANPGDGLARTSGGLTTLRSAIMETNVLPTDDVIILNAGNFSLSLAGPSEDMAATGDLDVVGNLALVGAGADQTSIDAAGLDRVFDLFSGVTFDISGVTLRGGNAGADNGGQSTTAAQSPFPMARYPTAAAPAEELSSTTPAPYRWLAVHSGPTRPPWTAALWSIQVVATRR